MDQVLMEEISQLEARFCAALSDPKRLMIVYALHQRPMTVTKLADELGFAQPTASRHLQVLAERGIVAATRQGNAQEYHLTDERVVEALDILRAVLRDMLLHGAELAGAFSQESGGEA